MSMKNYFSTLATIPPIRILVWYLALMSFLASVNWAGSNVILYISLVSRWLLLFTPAFIINFVWQKLTKKPGSRLEHKLITATILYLLFDSLTPWWILVALSVVTEIIQRVWRLPTGPVINPAAGGIIVIGFLTGYLPTWWATNFAPRLEVGLSLAAILTTCVAGYVAYRYKKLPLVISSLVSCLLLLGLTGILAPIYLLLDGTLLFYLLVMAAEPKTSPVLLNQQILYGLLIGILLVFGLAEFWLEPYIIALLTANLAFNGYRWWQMRQRLMANRQMKSAATL